MKKKQEFNEFAEEARDMLKTLLGDDEDAIEAEMEDMVYPMLENESRQTGSEWDNAVLDITGFAQVGSSDYWEKQRFEGDFLKKRIVFLLGPPPDGLRISWKGFPHDFGTYHSLSVRLDWNNDKHVKYFNKMEEIDANPLEEEMNEIWEQMKSGQLDKDNQVFNLLKSEDDHEPEN